MNRSIFRHKDEIRIYIQSMLKAKKAMKLDQIHKELFDLYHDTKKFPLQEKDIDEILNDVARKSHKTGKWILNESEQVGLGLHK